MFLLQSVKNTTLTVFWSLVGVSKSEFKLLLLLYKIKYCRTLWHRSSVCISQCYLNCYFLSRHTMVVALGRVKSINKDPVWLVSGRHGKNVKPRQAYSVDIFYAKFMLKCLEYIFFICPLYKKCRHSS